MSPFESWALLLLAAATLVMLLRVHYLTGQPAHVCPVCNGVFRGQPEYYVDNACCSAECADSMAAVERLWRP